jgi:hypothetical protein
MICVTTQDCLQSVDGSKAREIDPDEETAFLHLSSCGFAAPHSVLLRCFKGFILESAKALRELHRDGIAHLDVHTFNVGFRIVKPRAGHDAAPARAARAVLIDLDLGVWDPSTAIHFSSPTGATSSTTGQQMWYSALRAATRANGPL